MQQKYHTDAMKMTNVCGTCSVSWIIDTVNLNGFAVESTHKSYFSKVLLPFSPTIAKLIEDFCLFIDKIADSCGLLDALWKWHFFILFK